MHLEQINLSQGDFLSNQEYSECVFEGNLPANHIAYAIRVRDCHIEKANFDSAKLIKLHLTNVQVSNTTLTGTNLSECSLDTTTFTKCRLTGTTFSEGRLEDCIIKGSAVNMALFRFATLKNVRFESCNLQGADFLDAKLKKVVFTDCDLEGVDFSHANMNQVDLRGSQLTNIRGIADLKGATISSQQLISLSYALAVELGIIVTDS